MTILKNTTYIAFVVSVVQVNYTSKAKKIKQPFSKEGDIDGK